MDLQELPIGFGMALAQRPGTMAQFGSLSETKQQELIRQATAQTLSRRCVRWQSG